MLFKSKTGWLCWSLKLIQIQVSAVLSPVSLTRSVVPQCNWLYVYIEVKYWCRGFCGWGLLIYLLTQIPCLFVFDQRERRKWTIALASDSKRKLDLLHLVIFQSGVAFFSSSPPLQQLWPTFCVYEVFGMFTNKVQSFHCI